MATRPTPVKGRVEKYRGNDPTDAGGCTWADVDAYVICTFVRACTLVGDAALFGTAREGKAIMLTVMSSGVADQQYWGSAQDASDAITGMIDSLVEYVRKGGSVHEKEIIEQVLQIGMIMPNDTSTQA